MEATLGPICIYHIPTWHPCGAFILGLHVGLGKAGEVAGHRRHQFGNQGLDCRVFWRLPPGSYNG